MIETAVWYEKYRPKTLDEMALPEETRQLIQGYLKAGEIEHLLLYGPPAQGKTTLARILTHALDCQVLRLNASKERGIDTIREQVTSFVRAMSPRRWNIVFLDEADHLTQDAQASLRNLMEEYQEGARFILTANYVYKIITPLQSRCQMIEMSAIPVAERAKYLMRVLGYERMEQEALAGGIGPEAIADIATVMNYAAKYTDMRRLLSSAQRSYSTHGALVPVTVSEPERGSEIYRLCTEGQWRVLVDASKAPGFDHQEVLKELFWAIPDTDNRAAILRLSVARALHESIWTPDIVVHFLGCCSDLMTTMRS